MGDFIVADDITDSILKGRVSADQLAGANDSLRRIAFSFGVSHPWASPLARRLAAAIACRDCCLDLVGTDATVQMDGSRQDDIYERKYKLYAQQASELEKQLTKADFLDPNRNDEEAGEEDGAWVQTIQLQRG